MDLVFLLYVLWVTHILFDDQDPKIALKGLKDGLFFKLKVITFIFWYTYFAYNIGISD